MNKNLFIIIILFFVFDLSFADKNNEEKIQNVLLESMNQINKNCPIRIDKDTLLDSTSTLSNTFTYNYTLTSYSYNEVLEDMKNFLKKQAVNGYCTAMGSAAYLRDNSINMILNYRDTNGVFINSIIVSPENCD